MWLNLDSVKKKRVYFEKAGKYNDFRSDITKF